MAITANDEPTEIEADVDKRFSSIVVNLPVQQTGTGTPSPTNPRPFTVWTDVSLYVSDTEEADEPTLSIQLPTPLYGGKIDMVRGEIATTYNSKESGTGWEMTQEGQFRCQVSAYNNGDETSTNVADLYAVHYETVSNKDAYDATDDLTCGLATIDGTTYLYVNDAQYTTLESFATHIADEVFVFRAHIPMSDVTEPHIVYLPEGTSYVWADAGFVDYTVSGTPPLSLPNSLGKPLKEWEVALSPYQDLHGYDNPWPAGGGKNKCNAQNPIVLSGDGNIGNTPCVIPSGTYTYSATTSENVAFQLSAWTSGRTQIGSWSSPTSVTGRHSMTFTIAEAAAYIRCYYNRATTISDIQVESGSTATAYAPYSNICPIHGTDKLTITTAGKNLFDKANYTDIISNGQVYGGINSYHTKTIQLAPNTVYTVSFSAESRDDTKLILINSNPQVNGNNYVDLRKATDSKTYTTDSSGLLYIGGLITLSDQDCIDRIVACNVMINVGSTALPYEPYNGSQTVITLPSTVYNGTVGSEGGESRWGEVDLGTLNYTYEDNYTRFRAIVSNIDDTKPVRSLPMLCECYKVIDDRRPIDEVPDKSIYSTQGNPYIYIKDLSYIDPSLLKASLVGQKLVYPLATPVQFALTTLTIPTPKGSATTWATAEDGTVESMEVTYVGKPT